MKKFAWLIFTLWISACSSDAATITSEQQESPQIPRTPEVRIANQTSPTPFQPLEPTPYSSPIPSPTSEILSIYIHPALDARLPQGALQVDQPERSVVQITPTSDKNAIILATRIFALAAPFPTITDGFSMDAFLDLWRSDTTTLLADSETASALSTLLGAAGSIELYAPDDLLNIAWQTNNLAIIPFESISPKWKVLEIEGQSPLQKSFEPENYPLTVHFELQGDPDLVKAVHALYGPESGNPILPRTNYDPSRLTTLAMTGVTALVRATAFAMEQNGLRYPARDIVDWLREADILHISNEVPFAENCPYPNPVQQDVVFCSDPRYIELLEEIGTDIVELTGDHFHDWGPAAMLYTLDIYQNQGWPVYGGGTTFDEGKQAALIEHNRNKFAFIGCNGKGGGFARASATTPGSVRCDFPWLTAEIEKLTESGYLVIATFQHFEYYTYQTPETMNQDFRSLAEAGAVIVSGSQAHHPHGFEFVDGNFIHFGLGNLFFDQYGTNPGSETAFIDRHVFYEGRYLGVELLTIKFEDFARSRPMNPAEREALLRAAFAVSGW